MAEQDYRLTRSSRPDPRDRYDDPDPRFRQRPRRDYHYEPAHPYHPDSRDTLSRTTSKSEYGSAAGQSLYPPSAATRTTYRVSQSGLEPDTRSRPAKTIVLDSRLDRDRELSDWEVIRPEQSESGAYIIETSSTSDYDRSGPRARRPTLGSDIEIISPPRPSNREPRLRRDRSLSRGTLQAMKEVQVTEDYSSEDERRSIRSHRTLRGATEGNDTSGSLGPLLARLPTSLRHDHSPESVTRRRSRSIGFIKKQLSHHDVSESRHERPGAEASIAGKLLIQQGSERKTRRRRGSLEDPDAPAGDYPPLRKSRTDVIDTYGAEVRRRRDGRGTDSDPRDYPDSGEEEYERREPYPPQRGSRRYRGERGRKGEDEFEDYYEKRSRRYD